MLNQMKNKFIWSISRNDFWKIRKNINMVQNKIFQHWLMIDILISNKNKNIHETLEFVKCINKVSNFIVDICDQFLYLSLGIQDLNWLSVGIVTNSKWSGNGGRKVTK